MNNDDKRKVGAAVIAVLAVAGASLIGQQTSEPDSVWYQTLRRPDFNPPDWVFAPVWTTLYALMAFALWRILRLPSDTAGRTQALAFFFAQLALNAAWTWMFFSLQNPLIALVNIIPQFLLILASIWSFWRLDRTAALCLAPLALWVAFASALTFEIVRLNA